MSRLAGVHAGRGGSVSVGVNVLLSSHRVMTLAGSSRTRWPSRGAASIGGACVLAPLVAGGVSSVRGMSGGWKARRRVGIHAAAT